MTHTQKASAFFSTLLLGGTLPISAHAKTFAELVNNDIVPFGNTIVELMYAIAFLFFIFGIARMFFSTNDETRQSGRMFAIWGVVALGVLFAVWGIIRVLLGILDSFNT